MQRKVAGILVEARWDGENLKAVVIGIGINIAPESVNPVNLPAEGLNFPATCVEKLRWVTRWTAWNCCMQSWMSFLPGCLGSPSQTSSTTGKTSLAYRDQWVELSVEYADHPSQPETVPASHPGRKSDWSYSGWLFKITYPIWQIGHGTGWRNPPETQPHTDQPAPST